MPTSLGSNLGCQNSELFTKIDTISYISKIVIQLDFFPSVKLLKSNIKKKISKMSWGQSVIRLQVGPLPADQSSHLACNIATFKNYFFF